MSELKPCPFQKPGETHDVRFIELKPGYGQIGCADCGFWFPSEEMISRKNAIERWNARDERACRWEAVTNPCGEVTEFMCECGCCMGYIPSFCPSCGARVVEQ